MLKQSNIVKPHGVIPLHVEDSTSNHKVTPESALLQQTRVKPLHFVRVAFRLWSVLCSAKMRAQPLLLVDTKRLRRCTWAISTQIPQRETPLYILWCVYFCFLPKTLWTTIENHWNRSNIIGNSTNILVKTVWHPRNLIKPRRLRAPAPPHPQWMAAPRRPSLSRMHRGRPHFFAAPGGIEVGDSNDKWMSVCGYGLQLKTQAILDSYLFLPIYPPKTGNDDLQIDESSRDIFWGDGQYGQWPTCRRIGSCENLRLVFPILGPRLQGPPRVLDMAKALKCSVWKSGARAMIYFPPGINRDRTAGRLAGWKGSVQEALDSNQEE